MENILQNNESPLQIISLKKGLLLFFLVYLFLLINQFIDQSLNNLIFNSMQKENSSFLILAIGVFLNGLLTLWAQPLLYLFFLQKHHPDTQHLSFFSKLSDYTREWLRGMGEASLWMFVFIIPGLIRWVEYTLLPFVCFFDKNYQNGEIGALAQCRLIIRNHRLKLWALWIGFGIIIPSYLTAFLSDYKSLIDYPLVSSLIVFIEAIIQVMGFWLLWKLYLMTIKSKKTT